MNESFAESFGSSPVGVFLTFDPIRIEKEDNRHRAVVVLVVAIIKSFYMLFPFSFSKWILIYMSFAIDHEALSNSKEREGNNSLGSMQTIYSKRTSVSVDFKGSQKNRKRET